MPKTTILSFFSPKGKENKDKVSSNSSTPFKSLSISNTTKPNEIKSNFSDGDLVWAKLEGYPWWPSLVCIEQSSHKYVKIKDKKTLVHVQFFDDPVSRAWIPEKLCAKYNGSKSKQCEVGGNFFSSADNYDVKTALNKADDVLPKTKEERLSLVVDQTKMGNEENIESESKKRKNSNKNESPWNAKKRRRIIESDDEEEAIHVHESEDDYEPTLSTGESEAVESEASKSSIDPESEPDDSPVKDTKKRKMSHHNTSKAHKTMNDSINKSLVQSPFTPKVSNKTVSKLSSFQASEGDSVNAEVKTKYLHETLDFLAPENIKDKNKNRPTDENYNPSSLHIPSSFFNSLTPAMYQWWKIKESNFDIILFFKVGKFYELYHMDAAVGVQELGLIFMKGKFAHSGFPEISFGRYSDALVQRGYKVARVEQTETPYQNSARIKGRNLPKYEKTLRREVCRIITPGTQTLSTWDTVGSLANTNNYLLAITEKSITSADNKHMEIFGVCFIDTSIGVFHIGQFTDDRHLSHLCTMLANYTPCHVLYDRSKLSKSLSKILKTGLSSALQEGLTPMTQFWDAEKTLKKLSSGKYFVKNGEDIWPDVLKNMLSDSDSLGLTPATGYELALSSFGACIYYLQKCLIDYEVISMKQFQEFKPIATSSISSTKIQQSAFKPTQKLILDSVSLSNLEILSNSIGETDGTLINSLDHCYTPFGKRLLKQWICSPSCYPLVINDRLNAIEDLMHNNAFVNICSDSLKKMPDLERLLMKVHCLSKGAKQVDHPDNRAILYEEVKYSKKKIEDFLSILSSYETYHDILKGHQDLMPSFKSNLLKEICGLSGTNENGRFPDMAKILEKWRKAFDHKKAKENGKIIPNRGTNPEYDDAMEDIDSINNKLAEYLSSQKKILQCSKICYKGTANKRFQLEIPVDVANRCDLHSYTISGQRKGFKSYRTDETIEMLKEMEDMEARRDAAQTETMAIVFREFDKDYKMWSQAIQCISTLDVLVSLTKFCHSHDVSTCRPEIVENADEPFIEIISARHPCVTKTYFGEDFIPNDTTLGKCSSSTANCMVLTGPNMGGKSTLMRQVGLITVLAHIGCYVPAEKCKLTPVDRIFTRLGASDKILSGESTFYVELSETSSILKHATKHSLVLLDELGRGTATYDGTSIASAVVQEVADNIKCRTIFSTHYHSLVDDFKNNNEVKLGHMACMVENEDIDDNDPSKESLTFLYKLADGACPKSYGFHAARLADVPENVIVLARKKSVKLESINNSLKQFCNYFKT